MSLGCVRLSAYLGPGAKFICTENIICHGVYICQPVSQSVDYELHHTNYRPTTSRPTPWKFVESECRSTVVSQVRQPVRHSAVRPPTINRQRSGPGVLFTHTRRAVTFGPPSLLYEWPDWISPPRGFARLSMLVAACLVLSLILEIMELNAFFNCLC